MEIVCPRFVQFGGRADGWIIGVACRTQSVVYYVYYAVCNVQCAVFRVQCEGCSVTCAVYSVLFGQWWYNEASRLQLLRHRCLHMQTTTLGASLHSVHCTVYIAQCTLYSVHCTVYIAQCTLHSVHCTVYTAHCTVYTANCTAYTAYSTLCTAEWIAVNYMLLCSV